MFSSAGGANASIRKPLTNNIESERWVSQDDRHQAQAQTLPVPNAQKQSIGKNK